MDYFGFLLHGELAGLISRLLSVAGDRASQFTINEAKVALHFLNELYTLESAKADFSKPPEESLWEESYDLIPLLKRWIEDNYFNLPIRLDHVSSEVQVTLNRYCLYRILRNATRNARVAVQARQRVNVDFAEEFVIRIRVHERLLVIDVLENGANWPQDGEVERHGGWKFMERYVKHGYGGPPIELLHRTDPDNLDELKGIRIWLPLLGPNP